jgi:preprotein translocase subunit Sec63
LNWEPWSALGLTPPTNYFEGFNPPEVKKAYRNLAKLHHPDKVSADVDQEEAKKKWLDIQKAYDCLTDRKKFDNWITYGNPEGSILSQSMDIALPSWMTDESNQITMLLGFFVTVIMIPIVIISKLKDSNDTTDLYFPNGILKQSATTMLAMLKEVLEKNMRKKVKVITQDQWIEIFESCEEMATINYELNKKNNVKHG